MENKTVELIAEIAQAHNGSIEKAHAFIDALAGTGIHTIKFQVHIAEAESSSFEPFRIQIPGPDKNRFDYWKRMEFDKEQWKSLKLHCEEKGMQFLSSPFSIAAVELMEELGLKRYKVGSGDITNLLLLDKIARTGKPIIISSGLSDWNEIEEAVKYVNRFHHNLSLMQCTSSYPTAPWEWGLHLIPEMKRRFGLRVGYSDHSGNITAGIAAIALGAGMLEFHVKLNDDDVNPDASSSLNIPQVIQLTESCKMLQTSFNAGFDKQNIEHYHDLRQMFGKSLAVNKSLKAGQVIELSDLESKKPKGKGIPASEFQDVIGKKLKHPLFKWNFLNQTDLDEET